MCWRIRPYQHDSTASRPLSEVKHVRAWLVLRWGTTLESQVLFFCCLSRQPPSVYVFLSYQFIINFKSTVSFCTNSVTITSTSYHSISLQETIPTERTTAGTATTAPSLAPCGSYCNTRHLGVVSASHCIYIYWPTWRVPICSSLACFCLLPCLLFPKSYLLILCLLVLAEALLFKI